MNDIYREMEQRGHRAYPFEDHVRVDHPNGGSTKYYASGVEEYRGPQVLEMKLFIRAVPPGERRPWWHRLLGFL